MDSIPPKNKAMTKDEILCLVELIECNKIITSKETNVTTNKLKDEAWVSLTAAFNAKNGSIPRQKDQLKSKWDNLKKAAHWWWKAGIPSDEILTKVESLLGSTCNGFVVPFGGDGIGDTNIVVEVLDEYGDGSECLEADIHKTTSTDLILTPTTRCYSGGVGQKRKAEKDSERKFLFGMPTLSNSLKTKEKRRKEKDDTRQQLNLAAKNYYDMKATKIESEIKLLQLELANK